MAFYSKLTKELKRQFKTSDIAIQRLEHSASLWHSERRKGYTLIRADGIFRNTGTLTAKPGHRTYGRTL